MSIEILKMRNFRADDNAINAIDIAFPVQAIECEATPPLENQLDAYEEAVLRLLSLGLSVHGIANTLHAAESLTEVILSRLEEKRYAKKEPGKPWTLTDDGFRCLDGSIQERASNESQYGYMFINAIKKDVLPYFYLGNVEQISLAQNPLPSRLTIDDNDNLTFSHVTIKLSKLNKAYKTYIRTINILKNREEYDPGTVEEEADELFTGLDDFDEETEDADTTNISEDTNDHSGLRNGMFIRALEKEPVKKYLQMRILIDPGYPGGYRVRSPFDLDGIDDDYFLRQIQWLEQSDVRICLNEKPLGDFLYAEIRKFSVSYAVTEKDFRVFVLEEMPLLAVCQSRMTTIYDDMGRIYSLMQRQDSLLEKENIVSSLSRLIVEALFNIYFRTIGPTKLKEVRKKALDDIEVYDEYYYKKHICRNVGLGEDKLQRICLKPIAERITRTYGNSILEKFINMLIVEYYLNDEHLHRFLFQPGIETKYDRISILNSIRNKVSHDTNDRFSVEDYDTYMSNVFVLINDLLEAFREGD